MSTSYPYLAIARRHHVNYGDVLWYAYYRENNGAPNIKFNFNEPHLSRLIALSSEVKDDIDSAQRAEFRRRLEVTMKA